MSESKPKLTLMSGINGAEKSPSPSSAKLMLNHGKPNFTINRVKTKNDTQCPFSPQNPEAASVVLKSTANNVSNGYVKPTLMKIPLSAENEVSKVVLRRTKLPEENGNAKPMPEADEPEFVKAQRKIAERLANQNNLDFESRKSGYFTHVMISPTSPTKQFEVPVVENHKLVKASVVEVVNSDSIEPAAEEEPKKLLEKPNEQNEIKKEENKQPAEVVEARQLNGSAVDEQKPPEVVEAAKAMIEELVQTVVKETPTVESPEPAQNGVHNGSDEEVTLNGASNGGNNSEDSNHITQNDVNFEAKTITSFAKELSSEPNKYPDTVKVVTETNTSVQDDLMQDMYKMKFDIHAENEDIKVVPTVRATEQ